MSRTQADAEDAVQEIFSEVWRAAGRFDPERGSERAFVATIARRRLIDRIRATQREREQRTLNVQLDQMPAMNTDMETCVEARRAGEVLAQIQPERRQVLRLSLMEGMSHAQIASALELPLGTVKSHARRGLMQVREALLAGNAPKPGKNTGGSPSVEGHHAGQVAQ